MIKPSDIEDKKFSRAKRGYDVDEVDEFLDLIAVDLEKVLLENRKLKSDVNRVQTMLDDQLSADKSVNDTLQSAKELMDDIASSAEKRAEIIIKNAEMEASMITKDARESISRLTDEGKRLRKKILNYKERYKSLLENEFNKVDMVGEDILEDIERDFIPASMAELSKNTLSAKIKNIADENSRTSDDKKDTKVKF